MSAAIPRCCRNRPGMNLGGMRAKRWHREACIASLRAQPPLPPDSPSMHAPLSHLLCSDADSALAGDREVSIPLVADDRRATQLCSLSGQPGRAHAVAAVQYLSSLHVGWFAKAI